MRIVAVDSVGSVTFGGAPGRADASPAWGHGVRPPLLDDAYVDEVVLVAEARHDADLPSAGSDGFLFGGSTGTVVAGAEHWLTEHDDSGLTAVAIAPDLGERYLDTIYDDDWVADQVKEPQPPPPVGPTPSAAHGAFAVAATRR